MGAREERRSVSKYIVEEFGHIYDAEFLRTDLAACIAALVI